MPKIGNCNFPPDINKSLEDFSIEEYPESLKSKAIRFGISAVKMPEQQPSVLF